MQLGNVVAKYTHATYIHMHAYMHTYTVKNELL